MTSRVMKLMVIVFSLYCVTFFIGSVGAFSHAKGGFVGSYFSSPPVTPGANTKVNPTIPEPQKDAVSPAQQKLSSDLLQRVTSDPSGPQNALPTGGDRVYVYVYMNPPSSTHDIDPYVLNVTDRDEQNHIAVAWVNINYLGQLASLPEVRQIQTVTPPQTNPGSSTESSDRVIRTGPPVDPGMMTVAPAGTSPRKTPAASVPGPILIGGMSAVLIGIRAIRAKKPQGEVP
jgi:hypothetical protein